MNSSACRFLVALALVLSLGLHWTALQSAAWLGMIVSYSQDASIEEALEKTFDGEHPCQLCKFVEQGAKKQDEDKKSNDTIKKIELMAMVPARFITPPMPVIRPPSPLVALVLRADTPPLPPPIAA